MVEAHHQLGRAASESHPLVEAPCLPEGVAPVIAPEIDSPAPPFYQTVYRRDGQRAALPGKEPFVVPVVSGFQKSLDHVDAGFVKADPAAFVRLLLAQLDLVHLAQISDLSGGDPQEVRGAEISVDPEDEKGEVAGIVGQKLFDRFYVFGKPNRLHLDLVAHFGVIAVLAFFHGPPFVCSQVNFYYLTR